MSDTTLDRDSPSPRVSSVLPALSTATNAEYFLRIATDKVLHAATPPIVLQIVGYGAHLSMLQRFHPINLTSRVLSRRSLLHSRARRRPYSHSFPTIAK